MTFDLMINAMDGFVTGILMSPITNNNVYLFANGSISNERTYVIDYLHKLLGYCGQETLNNQVKMYEFKSPGKFETFEQYVIREGTKGKFEQELVWFN
jgi:hypothetical protein